MGRPIYLDYNATTPLDPRALERMLPYLQGAFGNPSSGHTYGQEAEQAVIEARTQVAALINAQPDEIIFTGGGSESDNLAIKGTVFPALGRAPHVITSSIDHPAVLTPLSYLEQHFGVHVTRLPVDEHGLVDPDDVRRALSPQTVLVSVIHANNEVGTVQPIRGIAHIAHEAGAIMHTDAAQSVGKIPVDVADLGVDLMTLAAHKLYGPKGIGALYVRRGTRLDPLIHGGGQEHGLRSGTENVASIVGFGEAARIARESVPMEEPRLRNLRDTLHRSLAERVSGLLLNGHPTLRLPNTLNVSLTGMDGSAILAASPRLAASTGSACHAGRTEPSSVLLAMGLPRERALGAIRLSVGRWTTAEEIEEASSVLAQAYRSSDVRTAQPEDVARRPPSPPTPR